MSSFTVRALRSLSPARLLHLHHRLEARCTVSEQVLVRVSRIVGRSYEAEQARYNRALRVLGRFMMLTA